MPSRIVPLPPHKCRGTLLRRVALGGQPRRLQRKRTMRINKRNIDTNEASNPGRGPTRAGGTGTHAAHRRENELAAGDAQRRGPAAKLRGGDPNEPMTM